MLMRCESLENILGSYPKLEYDEYMAGALEAVGRSFHYANVMEWLDPLQIADRRDASPLDPTPSLFFHSRSAPVFHRMRLPITATFEGELRREEPHALANATITIIAKLQERFGRKLPALILSRIYFVETNTQAHLVWYVAEKGITYR